MPLGQPHAVPGDHAVEDGVPGGRGVRVLEHQLGCVADVPAVVQGAPGQVGFLVGVEELVGPAADPVQHRDGQGVSAAEERGDLTAACGVADPQAGDVPALGAAQLVGDAEAHDPQLRVGRVQFRQPAEHVRADQEAVVVQVDHQIEVPELAQLVQGDVTAAGDAQVVAQLDAGRAVRQWGERRAVSDDHDVGRREVLLGDRVQQRLEFGGTVSHGQDGDAYAQMTHRRKLRSWRSFRDASRRGRRLPATAPLRRHPGRGVPGSRSRCARGAARGCGAGPRRGRGRGPSTCGDPGGRSHPAGRWNPACPWAGRGGRVLPCGAPWKDQGVCTDGRGGRMEEAS